MRVDPAQPTRPYRIVKTIEETSDVISLVLEPADGRPLPEIVPGQYVSVFVDLPDGDRQPRQYTVSSTAVGTRLQITVRRVLGKNGAPNGRVSTYLHDLANAGDILEVGAPAGDFVLTPSDSPLLLASAGAGITTVLPIVEHIVRTQPRRPVIAAHADRTAQDHALRQTVQRWGISPTTSSLIPGTSISTRATRAPGKATWTSRTFHCLMTSTFSPADHWPSCTTFVRS